MDAFPGGANFFQNSFRRHFFEIAGSGSLRRLELRLITRVSNHAVCLQITDSLQLPFVQMESRQHPICEPVAPDRDGKLSAALSEVRLRKAWARLSRIIIRVPVPYFSM